MPSAVTQKMFTERFRPKDLQHMLLLPRIREQVKDMKVHQNILLTGNPGTGKTTLAKILAEGYDHIYINVSNESSVETVRTSIIDFCSTASLLSDSDDRTKVVILDEMDGASDQFYKALRATVEMFAANSRFIGTCNFISKVPDTIQSRFEVISFDPVNKEEEEWMYESQMKRMRLLSTKLGIGVSDDALAEFMRRNFPDMRKMYNRMQSWHIKGIETVELDDVKAMNWSFAELFDLISSPCDPVKNYQEVIGSYSDKVDEVMVACGHEFIQWIRENRPEKTKAIPKIAECVSQYQAQRVHVIDQALNLSALVFKLQEIYATS
jgi:DNA polymerase III delta prime subunit